MSDWIPVSERLPEEDEWVLVFSKRGRRPVHDSKLLYVDEDYGPQWICSHSVTHWMPLPEPPEHENKDSREVKED